MPLIVTAFYASLLALVILTLAFRVIQMRWSERVSLGDGGNKVLNRRMRGHGNAVETIPIALILLGLCESIQVPHWALHVFGLMLLSGRMLHAIHFWKTRKSITMRFSGMVLTIVSIFAMAVTALVKSIIWMT